MYVLFSVKQSPYFVYIGETRQEVNQMVLIRSLYSCYKRSLVKGVDCVISYTD